MIVNPKSSIVTPAMQQPSHAAQAAAALPMINEMATTKLKETFGLLSLRTSEKIGTMAYLSDQIRQAQELSSDSRRENHSQVLKLIRLFNMAETEFAKAEADRTRVELNICEYEDNVDLIRFSNEDVDHLRKLKKNLKLLLEMKISEMREALEQERRNNHSLSQKHYEWMAAQRKRVTEESEKCLFTLRIQLRESGKQLDAITYELFDVMRLNENYPVEEFVSPTVLKGIIAAVFNTKRGS